MCIVCILYSLSTLVTCGVTRGECPSRGSLVIAVLASPPHPQNLSSVSGCVSEGSRSPVGPVWVRACYQAPSAQGFPTPGVRKGVVTSVEDGGRSSGCRGSWCWCSLSAGGKAPLIVGWIPEWNCSQRLGTTALLSAAGPSRPRQHSVQRRALSRHSVG